MERLYASILALISIVLIVVAQYGIAVASSTTYNGNNWSITIATDSDSYTLGETVTVTITFSGEFNGTILLVVTNSTGDNIYGDARNLEKATNSVFTFTLREEYGTGVFTVKASIKGSIKTDDTVQSVNVGADKLKTSFEVESPAQPAGISLVGVVVNENNAPVSGALVYVPGTTIRAYTDNNGFFTIYFPSEGTYTLRLEKNDYYPATYIIRVNTTNTVVQLRITTLAYQIASLKKEVAQLSSIISELNNTVTSTLMAQKELINNIIASISNLNSTITAQIDSITSTISMISGNITSLSNIVKNLENRLNTISREYASKQYVEELYSGLRDNITSIISNLKEEVNSKINALNSSLIDLLDSELKSLKDLLSRIQSQLSLKIRQVHDNLSANITRNANSISGLKEDINKLDNSLGTLAEVITNTTQALKKDISNSALYGIIGIIVGIIGIVIAAFALMLIFRKMS